MAIELVVTEPFGLPDGSKTYWHGDVVEKQHVELARKSFGRHVVQRITPDEPTAEPAPAVIEVPVTHEEA